MPASIMHRTTYVSTHAIALLVALLGSALMVPAHGRAQSSTGPMEAPYEIAYERGWNALSIPVDTHAQAPAEAFPGSIAVFTFTDGAFRPATSVVPGIGYWVLFDEAGTLSFSGAPITRNSLSLAAGWNLVAGLGMSVHGEEFASRSEGAISAVLDATTLETPQTIWAGRAYWVQATSPSRFEYEAMALVSALSTEDVVWHLSPFSAAIVTIPDEDGELVQFFGDKTELGEVVRIGGFRKFDLDDPAQSDVVTYGESGLPEMVTLRSGEVLQLEYGDGGRVRMRLTTSDGEFMETFFDLPESVKAARGEAPSPVRMRRIDFGQATLDSPMTAGNQTVSLPRVVMTVHDRIGRHVPRAHIRMNAYVGGRYADFLSFHEQSIETYLAFLPFVPYPNWTQQVGRIPDQCTLFSTAISGACNAVEDIEFVSVAMTACTAFPAQIPLCTAAVLATLGGCMAVNRGGIDPGGAVDSICTRVKNAVHIELSEAELLELDGKVYAPPRSYSGDCHTVVGETFPPPVPTSLGLSATLACFPPELQIRHLSGQISPNPLVLGSSGGNAVIQIDGDANLPLTRMVLRAHAPDGQVVSTSPLPRSELTWVAGTMGLHIPASAPPGNYRISLEIGSDYAAPTDIVHRDLGILTVQAPRGRFRGPVSFDVTYTEYGSQNNQSYTCTYRGTISGILEINLWSPSANYRLYDEVLDYHSGVISPAGAPFGCPPRRWTSYGGMTPGSGSYGANGSFSITGEVYMITGTNRGNSASGTISTNFSNVSPIGTSLTAGSGTFNIPSTGE
jgi:hypothetical protein